MAEAELTYVWSGEEVHDQEANDRQIAALVALDISVPTAMRGVIEGLGGDIQLLARQAGGLRIRREYSNPMDGTGAELRYTIRLGGLSDATARSGDPALGLTIEALNNAMDALESPDGFTFGRRNLSLRDDSL